MAAWKYIRDVGGSACESKYPYVASKGWCRWTPSIAVGQGDKSAPETGVEINVTMDGDSCSIVWKNGFTINVVPGQENEFTITSGQKVKVTPKWEGSVLVSYGNAATGHVAKRYLEGDYFVQEYNHGDVTSKRYFKRA